MPNAILHKNAVASRSNRSGPMLINKSISVYLDATRWLAACAVAIQHLRRISHAEPFSLPDVWAVKVICAMTFFGHEAVIIFFVVSGFLVGGVSLGKHDRFSASKYFADRFGRIYAVLVPSLLLTFVLGTIAFRAFPSASQVYPATDLGFTAFVGNLLSLQTIFVPMFGGNGPLWSLCNEWWYYVLFGCGMIFAKHRTYSGKVLAAVGILFVVWVLPFAISSYFLIWLLGTATFIFASKSNLALPRWLSFGFFAVVVVGSNRIHSTWAVGDHPALVLVDCAVGASYCLTMLSVRLHAPLRFVAIHRRMASFSYSLYLVHMPVGLFLSAALRQSLADGDVLAPGMQALLFITSVIASYATALVMYALFESRSHWLQARALELLQRIGRRRLLAA